MTMFVVALDPGETTGVAVWREGKWAAFQLPGWEAIETVDLWLADVDRPDLVISEEYRISRSTLEKGRQGMTSIEQIGALRYLCKRSRTPFKTQSPADAKSFSSDGKLRALKWWTPNREHARDASRHLLLGLVRNCPGAIDILALTRALAEED